MRSTPSSSGPGKHRSGVDRRWWSRRTRPPSCSCRTRPVRRAGRSRARRWTESLQRCADARDVHRTSTTPAPGAHHAARHPGKPADGSGRFRQRRRPLGQPEKHLRTGGVEPPETIAQTQDRGAPECASGSLSAKRRGAGAEVLRVHQVPSARARISNWTTVSCFGPEARVEARAGKGVAGRGPGGGGRRLEPVGDGLPPRR